MHAQWSGNSGKKKKKEGLNSFFLSLKKFTVKLRKPRYMATMVFLSLKIQSQLFFLYQRQKILITDGMGSVLGEMRLQFKGFVPI